jgi:hypothetical protein
MEADKPMIARERWYRDSIWQFIGTLIALAAIGVSVWFFVLQRNVKSVQVVVLAETSLLEIPSLVAGDVQVLYQGRPIPNLTPVQVKVENNGTVEIRNADYEKPITLVFPEGAEVLDSQVLETKPVDLALQVEKQGNKAVLSPVLLNAGDRAIVRFVLAGMPTRWSANSLGVSGRIAGVKELSAVSAVTEQQPSKWSLSPSIMALLFLCLVMGGMIWFWIRRQTRRSKISADDKPLKRRRRRL